MDDLSRDLLDWYDQHRRILPWREEPTVYRVWISEVMLQQTRVETGLAYFERFMRRFPSVEELANSPLDDVLTLWAGLGYYSRARNLHKAAKMVADAGKFPLDIKGLRDLPGVGEYMAAAVGSIALGLDEATVDGNIARVMSRIHMDGGPRSGMWTHARSHLPRGRAGDYNQALMDLGSRICIPKTARCSECPIGDHCRAFAADRVADFPPPKVKKPPKESDLDCMLLRRDGKLWAAKRPPTGLWAGLWAFPEMEKPSNAEAVGAFTHVLSHRRFRVKVWTAEGVPGPVPADWGPGEWLSVEELLARGISALTKKSLALFQDSGTSWA
jgi:A/G-specific adenine glycosylase